MKRALWMVLVPAAMIGVYYWQQASASPEPQGRPAQATTPAFDSGRAWEHLRQIVSIGPRPAGSSALRQTRAYITRQISSFGLTVEEQPFKVQTPIGEVEMVNLIVRLPGRRPDRLLIGGHYDTKLYREVRFVGASDGGSSAAFLIELARVLKDRPRELTYELIWLDGEEAFCPGWTDCGRPDAPDNTYGSRHYVQTAQKAGALASLRAFVLVDMIGDRSLLIRRESNSTPWLKDIIWGTAKRLGHGAVFLDEETDVTDDHMPFLKAGIPAVDIIDLDYPQWHTPADDLNAVSARSLQVVGDVVVAALPEIEKRLAK